MPKRQAGTFLPPQNSVQSHIIFTLTQVVIDLLVFGKTLSIYRFHNALDVGEQVGRAM
jgi:hypothetical protein